MTTEQIEQWRKEFILYINERIDFLTDHWTENDKEPFTFGGWREEIVGGMADSFLSKAKVIEEEGYNQGKNDCLNKLSNLGRIANIKGRDKDNNPEEFEWLIFDVRDLRALEKENLTTQERKEEK